ncbi:hypothetical protein Leryth_016733 [Lithospermum erythrorhizon]|nr:hypothetical protein Leryth_016733 [Lithospermum erythrorhizon]
MEAEKEVEMARKLLAKETYERQMAELNALKESIEKHKLVDELFIRDGRYRKYSKDEIESATEFFSEARMIGEGGYGTIYRCNLDHTPVAVKVLHPDGSDKKEEFLKEVEVLGQLRHPHIVLLIGACPDNRCLIYEYMENGNLDDHIFQRDGRAPLPWFSRLRIIVEVACGLAYLHNLKPHPIIHRDLKPDDVTEYQNSILAGTLPYMDPEYLRTGTVRPKSDLFAFGITILQLLSAHGPNGLILKFEDALKNNRLIDVLDNTVVDWPSAETKELAQIALRCTNLQCRDRPDLETEVMPVLRRLADIADVSAKTNRNRLDAPSHFFCPILLEIMDDPHIASDGFTYDHVAIHTWLDRHDISPVTKQKFQHKMLIPNNNLHSAIQQWRLKGTQNDST